MDVEYDPGKDRLNQQKHGISLAKAARLDLGSAEVVVDARRDYGEARWQAYWLIDGRVHVLAFTMRGDILKAISLRRANQREVKRYG